jgi:hypothetical protein
MLRIAAEIAQGNLAPSFNVEPFLLGAYDQIANYRGGKAGRARHFEVGITVTLGGRSTDVVREPLRCRAIFEKQGAQPVITDLVWNIGVYSIQLKRSGRKTEMVTVNTPGFRQEITGERLGRIGSSLYFDASMLPLLAMRIEERSREGGISGQQGERVLRELYHIFGRHLHLLSGGVHAFAPVRSRPVRTYNPIEESPSSEGSHIPMVLAKTYFTEGGRWQQIKSALKNFGNASGIFQDISVRPLGKPESDPFQIVVKIAGPPSNLIDVGYGVSQILPIVVDLLLNRSSRTYLLQQPEVHLHPRAQAELASFLATFVRETQSRLVIETHSDYIIDRLRSDIRAGKNISCDDVILLFFERQGLDVKIQPIGVDHRGNLKAVPHGYRAFFLQEQQSLLGIA